MAAHFFIFFFSSMGAITPPVALAAYAAAALSGADVDRTGWLGFRLGLAGYVIPFLCMYFSGLLMIGTATGIVVGTLVGVASIALTSLVGHEINRRFTPSGPPMSV